VLRDGAGWGTSCPVPHCLVLLGAVVWGIAAHSCPDVQPHGCLLWGRAMRTGGGTPSPPALLSRAQRLPFAPREAQSWPGHPGHRDPRAGTPGHRDTRAGCRNPKGTAMPGCGDPRAGCGDPKGTGMPGCGDPRGQGPQGAGC